MNEFISNLNFLSEFLFTIIVVILASIITYAYRCFATKRNIVAKINFRTLHQKIVPRGGGIGFASLFSFVILGLWIVTQEYPYWMVVSIGLGGFLAAIIGFMDDVYEIPAFKKLFLQSALSLFFFITFYYFHDFPAFVRSNPVLLAFATTMWLFIPLWTMNLMNFVDGIDGMAVGASIFICFAIIIVLCITDGDKFLLLTFLILAAASVGFAFFNMPPASIFMGDAGSIFLGYLIGCLMLVTIYLGQISIWTWITILGYYLADTTITTILRIFMVREWYGAHRSHAYQNLARIKNNHAKVTYGVLVYNTIWILPLVIGSSLKPSWAPLSAILSLLPAVLLTLRFGPMLSKD